MIRHCLNEYRLIFTNSGAILVLFLSAVIYSLFYPIPYAVDVLREVPVALVDLDHTQMSRQLGRMIDANEFVSVVSRPANIDDARTQFDNREIFGIVMIPEGFQRDIRKGQTATIAAYYDTSTILNYRQLRTGVLYATRTMSAGIQVRRFEAQGYTLERAIAAQDPLPLLGFPLFNPSGGYGGYIIPTVFFLLIHQSLLLGIGMVSGLRRESVVDPIRPGLVESVRMVMGRGFAYVVIGFVIATYLFAMIRLYYHYPLRCGAFETYVFLLPFVVATVLFSMTISGFFKSREVALVILLFTSLPMVFVIGFAWPPEVMSPWVRFVSCLVPNTLGADGLLRLEQMGASLKDVSFNYHGLWLISGVYFVTAVLVTWLMDVIPKRAGE